MHTLWSFIVWNTSSHAAVRGNPHSTLYALWSHQWESSYHTNSLWLRETDMRTLKEYCKYEAGRVRQRNRAYSPNQLYFPTFSALTHSRSLLFCFILWLDCKFGQWWSSGSERPLSALLRVGQSILSSLSISVILTFIGTKLHRQRICNFKKKNKFPLRHRSLAKMSLHGYASCNSVNIQNVDRWRWMALSINECNINRKLAKV